MKVYVPTQGPKVESRDQQQVVEWLERELQGIKSALDTAFDLNLEAARTTPSGQRLKDREGMLRYVPDSTLDPDWATAELQYYHNGQWVGAASHEWAKQTCMQWMGEWAPGEYTVNQVVLDYPFLMIANKTTGDRAAPQPIGDPAYTVPDAPTWTPGLDPGWVWTGNLFTMQESGWVKNVRAWIPVTDTARTHRILILQWIDIPSNDYTIMGDFIVPVSSYAVGWYSVSVNAIWYTGGQYEVALLSENTSLPTLGFEGQWQYAGASQSGDPYWGGWNHNNQHTTIRFHEQQSSGLGSAAPWLAELGSGDTVIINTGSANWEYSITSAPTVNGQIYSYSCTRTVSTGTISSGTECDVEWGTPGARPDVEYVELPSHWATNTPSWASDAQGTLDTDIGSGGRTTSDSAYGADVEFQQGVVSDDWDFMALSN